ncbi:hypothetical protein BU25DRAFT_216487 [Macroventuria anomochaeta]|uniref:Uncharacterized protein n=1 Tax=Macroventuria anomochaeta TaxID=301207 RepID=A0ACB6RL90_9PLEO|nr:uncharacterized protein BU25DRAFT_216487 [Macroventuria anomochaeta]KAF2622165.1 hypothetical protein BU25DRAFT_216487 [Macroventuria anomochaeta]
MKGLGLLVTGSAPTEQPRNHGLVLSFFLSTPAVSADADVVSGFTVEPTCLGLQTRQVTSRSTSIMDKTDEEPCFGIRLALGGKDDAEGRKGETYTTDRLTYAVDDRVVVPDCATTGERSTAVQVAQHRLDSQTPFDTCNRYRLHLAMCTAIYLFESRSL